MDTFLLPRYDAKNKYKHMYMKNKEICEYCDILLFNGPRVVVPYTQPKTNHCFFCGHSSYVILHPICLCGCQYKIGQTIQFIGYLKQKQSIKYIYGYNRSIVINNKNKWHLCDVKKTIIEIVHILTVLWINYKTI